jgi:N-methylhydantoinase A
VTGHSAVAAAESTGPARARYRFGFDIGGTFTDFVLMDVDSGVTTTYKTLTTPHEPASAVLDGWRYLLDELGLDGGAVEMAVHGTTLITNALIEREGGVTGLVTTAGFRDVLEMRKEMRYDIYDLLITLPEPLVPRPLRLEVDERVNGKGEAMTPLDLSQLEHAKESFARAGVEAVAVCFLHSFSNPSHEQLAGAWLREHMPHVAVSLSCEVASEIREYERTSTTVSNAYVQPIAQRYLEQLGSQLAKAGFERNLYLMLSNGGITTLETAMRFPIRLVESGPAAGVLAAVFYGALIGERDLVSFDMGGTTAKMCLIKDGQPAMASSFEIARVHRFKRGSGLPVQVRSIELIEIGAGGGSIARVDDLGLLKVGPSSAGADPGPACYGLGGTEPTVTDADTVLGYLNPRNFLGGRMELVVDEAERAIRSAVAEPMGIDVVEAARGIHQVVNENMIAATRIHVAERGADVRRMFLMAFGGAGPVHADAIARALKMRGYIVPASAGVTSALGFLTAPMSFELARSFVGPLTQERLAELDGLYDTLEDEGRELLRGAGLEDFDMRFVKQADLRHAGQGHEIVLELPFDRLANADLDGEVRPLFYSAYETVYGHAHRHLQLEIVTCRLTATGPRPTISIRREGDAAGDAAVALTGSRPAYFAELAGFVETPTYDRARLHAGAVVSGPAIVEEKDSTAVIGPGATASVDALLDLVVTFD